MRLRTTLILSAALLIAVFALAGCGTTATKKTTNDKPLVVKKVSIEIKDFAFKPQTITIARKSRVTWTNKDAGTHSVDAGEFSSGTIGPGESYSYQFMSVGTFPYRCAVHPYMEGTIIVK